MSTPGKEKSSPVPRTDTSSVEDTRESTGARSKRKKSRRPTGGKSPRVKPLESASSPQREAAADVDPPQSPPNAPPPPLSEEGPALPGEDHEPQQAAAAGVASAQGQPPDEAGFRQRRQPSATPCIACFVALILLVFATVVALKFALPLWHPEEGDRDSSFCCPEEVKALARFVDTTVDPCYSFFDFVCSKIAEQRGATGSGRAAASSSVLSLIVNFEQDALTTGQRSGNRVSAFLRSLFASCMSAGSDENAAFLELPDLLVAVGATSYLRDANLVSAFAYLFLTNLKYRISSVVSVGWKRAGAITIAHRQRQLGDVLGSTFQRCIVASTATMKKIANRETQAEVVTTFASGLLTTYPKEIVSKNYTGSNAAEILQRWHVHEALKMASIDIGNVAEIYVDGSLQVDAFVRVVSSLNVTTADATPAYMLACSLHDAFMDLRWPSGQSEAERLPLCLRHLDSMPNLRNLMYFDEFGTDERLMQVTRVINTIVDTIEADFVMSLDLNREDVPRLKAFFNRISLAHPYARNRSYVRTFSNHSFLYVLLEGRAFELQESLNLARVGLSFAEEGPGIDYHYLYVHNAEKVVVSPALYALVRTDPTHTDIFNTPVVGLAVAEAVWKSILTHNTFLSDTARDSLESLVECFERNYLSPYEDELKCVEDRNKCIQTVAASLALSSVMRTFREQRWHKVEAVWPPLSLSHAQFFYLRESFYKCPVSPSHEQERDHVDVPLKYVGDFSAAFQCRGSDPMFMTQACVLTG